MKNTCAKLSGWSATRRPVLSPERAACKSTFRTPRTRIGIRMALGAQKIDMLTMILRQSFAVIGIGLIAGILGALAVTRLMSSLLYGVTSSDLSIYAVVTIVLSGAALVATYFPARRAMTVDPMVALRYE